MRVFYPGEPRLSLAPSRHSRNKWRQHALPAQLGHGQHGLDGRHRHPLRQPRRLPAGGGLFQIRLRQRPRGARGVVYPPRRHGADRGERARPAAQSGRLVCDGAALPDGLEPGRRPLRLRQQPRAARLRIQREIQPRQRRVLGLPPQHRYRSPTPRRSRASGRRRGQLPRLGADLQPLCERQRHRRAVEQDRDEPGPARVVPRARQHSLRGRIPSASAASPTRGTTRAPAPRPAACSRNGARTSSS